jgi:hypothetical protein
VPCLLATQSTYHTNDYCQQLSTNNLKLFSSNSIDKPRNPLFPSVSLNHKQEANLMASVNFQPMGQVNRQGAKLRSL